MMRKDDVIKRRKKVFEAQEEREKLIQDRSDWENAYSDELEIAMKQAEEEEKSFYEDTFKENFISKRGEIPQVIYIIKLDSG